MTRYIVRRWGKNTYVYDRATGFKIVAVLNPAAAQRLCDALNQEHTEWEKAA